MTEEKFTPGKYVGKAVYDGIRILTPEEVARLKRAREESEKQRGKS